MKKISLINIRQYLCLLIFILLIVSPSSFSHPIDQEDPFYHNLLRDGKYAYTQGNHAEAIENFKIALMGFLDNPPKLLECYIYLTVCYYEVRDLEQAKHFHDEIVIHSLNSHLKELNPDQALLDRYNEISEYFSPQETQTSSTSPSSKKEPDPQSEAPSTSQQLDRAQFFLNLARKEENLKRKMVYYRQALRYDPNSLEIHLELADFYIINESYDKAIKILNQAKKIDENNIKIHLFLGIAHIKKKKYQEAYEELNIVLQKNPDHKQAQELIKIIQGKIK